MFWGDLWVYDTSNIIWFKSITKAYKILPLIFGQWVLNYNKSLKSYLFDINALYGLPIAKCVTVYLVIHKFLLTITYTFFSNIKIFSSNSQQFLMCRYYTTKNINLSFKEIQCADITYPLSNCNFIKLFLNFPFLSMQIKLSIYLIYYYYYEFEISNWISCILL